MGKKLLAEKRLQRQTVYLSTLAIREILARAKTAVGKSGWEADDYTSEIIELAADAERSNKSIKTQAAKEDSFYEAIAQGIVALQALPKGVREEWESWIGGRVTQVLFGEDAPELPFEASVVDMRSEATAQAILLIAKAARRAHGPSDWDDEERSQEFIELLFDDDEPGRFG